MSFTLQNNSNFYLSLYCALEKYLGRHLFSMCNLANIFLVNVVLQNKIVEYEVWSSYNGGCLSHVLLGCDAVYNNPSSSKG